MQARNLAVTILVALTTTAGCSQQQPATRPSPVPPAAATATAAEPAPPPAPIELTAEMKQFFAPLPSAFESDANPLTEAKVALGRVLFFDKRLSKNQDVSCNTCHRLGDYGVDGDPVSSGHKQQKGDRNAPTVYNAGGHLAQFWDGRAADLEEQAKGPILNPIEMAMPDPAHVVKVLKSIPGYQKLFKAAFPKAKDPITYDNLGLAIGAFERRLVTPGKLDKFLQGDEAALDETEKRGMAKFVSYGCTTCHNGAAVGGTSFQKLGLVKEWPAKDEGRYKVTKDEADKHKFRVPTLRNIAKTGPYLHDGSLTDVNEVVRLMARHQLGRELSEADVADIAAFLNALTGAIPSEYIAQPELPKSGPKTPKPDPS